MIKFKQSQFFGDVNWLDYGGIWVVNESGDHWYIRELVNRRNAHNTQETVYVVFLAEIYTDLIKDVSKWEALTFGDVDKHDAETTPEWEKVRLYYQYGLADTIAVKKGNNYKKLFKEIRQHT